MTYLETNFRLFKQILNKRDFCLWAASPFIPAKYATDYTMLDFSKFSPRLLCFFTINFTYHDIAIDVLFIPFTAKVPFTHNCILLVSQIKIENKLM